jgi:hypothetical protein
MSKYEFKNLSTTYLVPLISKSVNINKPLLKGSFLYYIEESYLSEKEGLFLLFKWDVNYEEYLINTVEKHFDIDGEHIMVYCKYKPEDYNDVELIINGKYSEISLTNKKRIVNYHNVSSSSKVYKVLFKDITLKKQIEEELNIKLDDTAELGQIINKHKEVFDLKQETV